MLYEVITDVAGIGLALLRLLLVRIDHAGAQPQGAVDLAHPLGVTLGEVVVDRDDVHALSREAVEIGRRHVHEGLALAGLHFDDAARVEHQGAENLHVVVV